MIDSIFIGHLRVRSDFREARVVCNQIEHVCRIVVGLEAHELQMVVFKGN